jgi:hypothetical protein
MRIADQSLLATTLQRYLPLECDAEGQCLGNARADAAERATQLEHFALAHGFPRQA